MFSATVISGNSARFWKISAVGRLFGPDARHVLAADPDRPLGRIEEARNGPQDRRLAAARRPEEREELAARDLERGVAHGGEIAKSNGDAIKFDVGAHPLPCPYARPKFLLTAS